MDFEAVVLAQLQSIVESQAALLKTQSRLAKTIGAIQEQLQVSTHASERDLLSSSENKDVHTHTSELSADEVDQNDSDRHLLSHCDNAPWPGNICSRYFGDSKAPFIGEARSMLSMKPLEYSNSLPRIFCVILPDSRLEMFLDVACAMFALWDLSITSFAVSWGLEYRGVFRVGIYISPPFWTLDILRHFFMASYQKGELETGKIAIAKMYLKTYFFIDLIIVMLDWAFIALSTIGQTDHRSIVVLQALQIIKLLRIKQLFRVSGRLLKRWDLYAEGNLSEINRLFLTYVVLPSLYTLWGHHFFACLYYAVGSARLGNHGRCWFDIMDDLNPGFPFLESSLTNQYWAAFHFVIATISLAGNFEAPVTNVSERAVMMVLLVIGFIFGSVFCSLISAMIVDYQMKSFANSARLRQLRKYLLENSVRLTVYQRIIKQAEQRLLASDRLKEEDIDALTFMPRYFITEIRLEIQWPPLQRHALFRLYGMLDEDVPRALCNEGLNYLDLSVDCELFKEKDIAECAYIVTLGVVDYVQLPQQSTVLSLTRTSVEPGIWLSEAALFSKWFHVGSAHAKLSSRMLTIDASALAQVVLHRDPTVHMVAVEYGCEFHRRITSSSPPNEWPNDLVVPSTDYCEIVLALPLECQIEIGKCALDTLSSSESQDLLEEVLEAKAVIICTGDGDVYRIKSIVVLQVENEEGLSLFAQIGKIEGDSVSPSSMLPACTMGKGQLVGDCVEKALKTKFSFLGGKIDIVRTGREVIESASRHFSVRTRYYRNVVYCRFRSGENIGLFVVALNTSMQPFPSDSKAKLSPTKRGQSVSASGLRAFIDWSENGKGTVYAWLSQDQLDFFQTVEGTECLRNLLNGCEFHRPSSSEILM